MAKKIEEKYKKIISRFKQDSKDLGSALDAEDHNAYEWADETRKTVYKDIGEGMVEFFQDGEEVFAQYFPNCYEMLKQRGIELNETNIAAHAESSLQDFDYLVAHGRPPKGWADLSPKEKLFKALDKNNLAGIREALEEGADVNSRSESSLSPLGSALSLYATDQALIDLLIEHGADINGKESFELPTYVLAAAMGNEKITQMAIDRKLDLNFPSSSGTPLAKAAYYGHLNIIKMLVAAGADPNAPSFDTCSRPSSALHMAAESGQAEAVELLLKLGANPKVRNDFDRTPLETAKHWHRKQVIEILKKVE